MRRSIGRVARRYMEAAWGGTMLARPATGLDDEPDDPEGE